MRPVATLRGSTGGFNVVSMAPLLLAVCQISPRPMTTGINQRAMVRHRLFMAFSKSLHNVNG